MLSYFSDALQTMSCPICLEAVNSTKAESGFGVELCCGAYLYHKKCLISIAHWDDSVIPCPACRADVPFPVVYGNVLGKSPGSYVTDPFTRLLIPESNDDREVRDEWIAMSDYVMVSLDDDGCLDIILDIKSAIELQKPVFLRGSVPGGLAKKVNLPIPPPATRKRKLENALRDDLLCQAAKNILTSRVQIYRKKGLTMHYA